MAGLNFIPCPLVPLSPCLPCLPCLISTPQFKIDRLVVGSCYSLLVTRYLFRVAVLSVSVLGDFDHPETLLVKLTILAISDIEFW